MTTSELTPQNYKRIYFINWLLAVPFFVLFSWPYLYIAHFIQINEYTRYAGSIFFSLPFMITILHGHVTLALGSAHRHHFYNWLNNQPLTYGLFFHPVITSTRFRLILLAVSALLFVTGALI